MQKILTTVLVSFLGAAPLCVLAIAPLLSSLAHAQNTAGNNSPETAGAKPQKKRTTQWNKGGQYKGQGVPLTNFRQFSLKSPGNGQRWIRENSHFLLVRTDTGVIVSVVERAAK